MTEKTVPVGADEFLIEDSADSNNKKSVTLARLVLASGTTPLTSDWDIGDGRAILTDKIRARDAAGLLLEDDGGNGIKVVDGGIINYSAQSGVELTMSVDNIQIATDTSIFMPFDTEVADVQGEFNTVHIAGTTDGSTTANHLIDSGEDFSAQGILVGARVLNTTDDTVAYVTNVADYDLTLSADIMATGEGYRVYNARFTATEAGKYLVVLVAEIDNLADAKWMQAGGYKNRITHLGHITLFAPGTVTGLACWTNIVTLAATDYMEFYARQNVGTTQSLRDASSRVTIFKAA